MFKKLKPADRKFLPGNLIIAAYMGEDLEPMYELTEWTSDHAHTSWWRHSRVIGESGIHCGHPQDKTKWHCELHDESTYTEAYHEDWNALMRAYFRFQQEICAALNQHPMDLTYTSNFVSGIYNGNIVRSWQALAEGIEFMNMYNKATIKPHEPETQPQASK